jgi:hypothetical protein
MNKFSKLITVVAFAIFVLSTSLFAQEKTSKVADAEMKAALKMMNAYLDGLNIPVKGVVDLEAVIVRDKINKINKTRTHTIISKKKKEFWTTYFPMRYYPHK